MLMSVYLHDEIASVLKCYGNLSDVVNKVLDAASAGAFDFEDKPEAPNRSGARRYDIDITNEDYIELHRMYRNSPKISLRRLLYWFVENEMYEILEWQVVNPYDSAVLAKRRKLIIKARQATEALCQALSGEEGEIAENARQLIKELENRYV